jgi:hypothetical protein
MSHDIDPDDLVAAAARSIVRGAPSPDLRARVLASLEPEARRGPARLWWLVPAAVAAGVVAAVAVSLAPADAGLPAVGRPAVLVDAGLPGRPLPLSAAGIPAPHAVAPARRAARAAGATAVETEAERAWRASRLADLPGPAPIVIEVSQPEAVTIPLLVVRPSDVPRVTLAPIDPARWSQIR